MNEDVSRCFFTGIWRKEHKWKDEHFIAEEPR